VLKNNNLAPVLLFTYNRLEHTKKTIEHLKENNLAMHSDLIIFSDAGKSDIDYKKVHNVRRYLKSIKGFKSCTLIEREINFGLAKNIIEGVTEVINSDGKVIVLEDDLLTSKNFLCFMNAALEYYQDQEDIFSISGYTANLPSLPKEVFDTYLSVRVSSWGWGTWKHQWDNIDWDVSDYNEFIINKNEIAKFNRGGADMTRMLRHYMEGKNNSWAIRFSYAMHKKDKYCIYPKLSKIKNIGFGADATHTKNTNKYYSTLDITNRRKFKFSDSKKINKTIAKEFRYQFSFMSKAIQALKNSINKYDK
jgi:hypothetical protein